MFRFQFFTTSYKSIMKYYISFQISFIDIYDEKYLEQKQKFFPMFLVLHQKCRLLSNSTNKHDENHYSAFYFHHECRSNLFFYIDYEKSTVRTV